MSVHRMVNPVMAYAWGSRDGIATMQGRPAASDPEAELWMGAHPQAASILEGHPSDRPHGEPCALDALIEAEPVPTLGAEVAARFGARLPFLLKILSAAEPLSLQVHPDDALARSGFDAEEVAGVPRDAANRCFRDPYAKPEMLVAITDFQLLLGFRPAAAAAEALERLDVRQLSPVVSALRDGTPTGEAFLSLVQWPTHARAELVAAVRDAVSSSGDERAHWLDFLADRYPADPGVVGVMLLNYLTLRPWQGVYVAPGQIHAYLQGTGVEILGGSDNVVRGGLTPKHVALDQLRRVLSVDAAVPVVVEPIAQPDGEQRWNTPRPEFALSRLRLDGAARTVVVTGPQILLCVEGKVEVGDAEQGATVVLGGGESAFVSATTGAVTLGGRGVVMRATSGLAAEPRSTTRGEAAAARSKSRRRARNEWLILLVLTVAGTFLLRTFVVQSYRIPSGSMEKTLHGGCDPDCGSDRILVDKLSYHLHGVGRGDVVVFKATGAWIAAVGGPDDVVKRVIGLPGDTVQCCDAQGNVMVDGKSLHETYVFVNGPDPKKEFGPVTVPNGELWVMGDHRNDSSDSRYNGPVPISSVVGRAFMRIWPISRIGGL